MPAPAPETPVSVGIVRGSRGGRYLVRRRPPGGALAGFWEFPGGKCEPGETPEEATVRECREEAGLGVELDGLRRRDFPRYPLACVELSFFDFVTADPLAEPDPNTGFVWV